MSRQSTGSAEEVNPIKSDAELQMLVKKLDKIKKYNSFQRWKSQFLNRLDDFLYEKGMQPAEKSCNELEVKLKKLITKTTKVLDFIHSGDLCEEKKTVKASLALNEMCNTLEDTRMEIEDLIPSLKSDEKRKGFSKFHLGAALIRQGFHQYISMKAVEDAVTELDEKLQHVADRQQLDLFMYYHKQVQRFCDVMADLNLYAIMLKCVEFSTPPDEEESEDPDYLQIVVETSDGRKLRMEVDTRDTVGSIKDAIEAGLDIPAPRQVLQYKGNMLDNDGQDMATLGVKDGDVFTVEPLTIPITVNAPDGKKIQLMVDPSNYLSDLKRLLEPESGIPGKNQSLTLDGKELDDPGKKLEDYGIVPGTVLDLEPKLIKVTVQMPDNSTFQLEISPKGDTSAMKAAIEEQTGMAIPRQVLKHNGDELPKEGVSIKDMGIKDGSTVNVEIFKVPITVNAPGGNTIELLVDPTNYLSDLKRQLEPESGIPAKNQNLTNAGEALDDPNKKLEDYGVKAGTVLDLEPKIITVNVEMPDGKTFEIQVSPDDETPTIKDKIAAQSGMAVPRQVLRHNDKDLPTAGVSVRDMGLKDGSTINVDIFKVPITVNAPEGKLIELLVDPTDYIADLKRQLETESGIPAKNQNLMNGDKELDDPNKRLEDCGIKPGTVLDLEPKLIHVNVRMPDGKVLEIEISPRDETPTIKDKIAAKSGMAIPRQVLKHDGNELPAEGVMSKDMGIKNGSTIDVEIFKLPVTVKTWDDKIIHIDVEPTDDLKTIKKMLEPESCIAADNQVLSLEGKELEGDSKSAVDLGVKAGTVLNLEPRVISLKVATPDGKLHDVDIGLADTVDDIKKKIEDKTGIAVPRQVLKHDGEELPAGTPAKKLGLQDGSELTVDIFKLPVTVNNWDGKVIEIEVEPTDTLSSIKKMLEPESGIPSNNQVLSRKHHELEDDSKTAEEHGIQAGTVLALEPRNITVKVQTPDGQKHDVDIGLADTADDIKKKIEDKTGIAVPRQVLKHDGEELPAGTPAKKLGLQDGSELTVDIFKLPVTVNNWDGKVIEIEVEPTDTLSSIKKMLEPESGIPSNNQVLSRKHHELEDDSKTAEEHGIQAGTVLALEPRNITVKVQTPDGQKHDVEIGLSDTADDIKKKIEDKTGIAVPRQVLKHDGDELPVGTSAKKLGLQDGSELTVDIFKLPVTVNNWDGKVIEIEVEPTDTLSSIKKMLEPESGIPSNNQVLSRKHHELEDDSKTAEEHGIKAGTVLALEPRVIKVNVTMPDGNNKEVEICPSDDGDAIKQKIEAQTGLKAARQVLSFEGKPVPGKGATARDLGIRDGSTIQADIFKIPVTVNCWDGKKINVMVEPTETLSSIKTQLQPESGIAASNQCLSKRGDELVGDTKTANDHGIMAGSTLDLEPKLINVTVTLPDGQKHQISVAPAETGEMIKMKIEKETGMEAPRQLLKFNGKPIPNNSTARDVGLREGSNIDVEILKVPVTVNTWDARTIKIMVDPLEKMMAIKTLLEAESTIPANNQILSMNEVELHDNNRRAKAYGIQGGSVLYLEPRYIGVTVVMPDGSSCSFQVTAASTGDDIKDQVASKTNVASSRQVLTFNKKEILADYTVKGVGITDGSTIQCALFKIPITVETKDGKIIPLRVEPIETIAGIKQMLEEPSGIAAPKQVLTFNEEELNNNKNTATDCGIKKDSVLSLEPKDDPIVFVDVKYCTLFGVDRDEVIEKGILTPNQGNPLEFQETEKGSFGKEKMLKAMLDSPNLGVKPQIVVEKIEVEDYDVQEAEEVKSKWGVQLKKTQKSKRGDEFIFVDLKTGSVGLLDRKKMMEKKFITPIGHGKDETLKEGEKSTRTYDKYVTQIRVIFGIKATT